MALINAPECRGLKGAFMILEYSPFTFYLGGSRRMAALNARKPDSLAVINVTSTTDYDFFCTHSEEVEDFLFYNGFKDTMASAKAAATASYKDSPYTLDDETVRILKRDNVEIALKRNALFYRAVFESIPPETYCSHFWKSSPSGVDRSQITPLFNALYSAAHAVSSLGV